MTEDLKQLDTEQLLGLLNHDPEAEASERRLEEAREELRKLAGKPKVEENGQPA